MLIITKVCEHFPAGLTLHFKNVQFHELLKSFKMDSFGCLGLIKLFIDCNLLQCSNMLFLQILAEDFSLQINKIIITHDSIAIGVTDSEHPLKSP